MTRKDLMAVYGRLGLVLAAFAFILGATLAPLLPWPWTSAETAQHRSGFLQRTTEIPLSSLPNAQR